MRSLLLLAFALASAAAGAYDAPSLAVDAAAFLDAESAMRRDLGPVAAALRKSQPLMTPGEGRASSISLTAGSLVAPAYAYRAALEGHGPFAPFADRAEGASLAAPSLGGFVSFPGGLSLALNLSCMPDFGAAEGSSLLRVGASAYLRLLDERFYSVGLLAGGGASYVRGTDRRALSSSFLDLATPSTFSGSLSSEWQSGIVDLELFVHKTFFVINFYARGNLSLALGSSTSTLRDALVNGVPVPLAAAEYSGSASGLSRALVLAGGMELILGELKLAAEGGRDWLSGALYGSLGIRYGM